MSLYVPPGALERFIGTFYRVNAKTPPASPETVVAAPMTQLVIAKGRLMIVLENQTINVDIPDEDQVDDDQYQAMLQVLVSELIKLMQVPQYTQPIYQAMQRGGIVAHFEHPVRINPLTAGVGELDNPVQ